MAMRRSIAENGWGQAPGTEENLLARPKTQSQLLHIHQIRG